VVVGYGATTYGRRTGSLRLLPFPWQEIGSFIPGWEIEDRIRAWAIFGGVPYYLKEIDPERPLAETIRRAILYPDGLLREEPRFLLSQESRLREQATYMSALRAVAAGATRLNEIAQRLGRSGPDTGGRLHAAEVGRWWGSIRRQENGRPRSRSYEADVVAVDGDGAIMALGSCRWPRAENTDHEHGTVELDKLETIRDELGAPDADLYFFDRIGFSDRLRELAAEREDVRLVLADELG
jgi:hypothetical protein